MSGFVHDEAAADARTLIVGLGNPIRGDDGVGWRVADEIRASLSEADDVEIDELSLGGLRLMERLLGYERVVVIDAVATGAVPVGSVRAFPLEAFSERNGGHLTCAHDTSLATATELARRLGARVPDSIVIVGIETQPEFTFSETLSSIVARSVPVAAALALEIARGEDKEATRGIA